MDRMHTALLATFLAGNLGLAGLDARLHRLDERGSVTIEYVLWAVAVIAIVAIVVAAVKAYVTSQAGNIK